MSAAAGAHVARFVFAAVCVVAYSVLNWCGIHDGPGWLLFLALCAL